MINDNFHFSKGIDPTLKAETEKLIPVLNVAFYGWVLVDEDARILGANDDYLEFIGKEFGAIEKKKMVDVVNFATHLPAVIASGEPDLLYSLTYGDNRHFIASSFPLHNEATKVIGAIGIVVFRDAHIAHLRPLLNAIAKQERDLKQKWPARYTFEDIIGNSQAMEKAKASAKHAAQIDSPILLTGETGTGKEMFAHAIHAARKHLLPFVAVNMAGIPRERLETELLGKVPVADTDRQRITGKLNVANHGTLFLDEVGDLPLHAQGLLLRVLEDKTFTPLGAVQRERVDVRIIAATSRDLGALVKETRFLAELYYRLNGVPIALPPLRQRVEDMKALCKCLLRDIAKNWGEPYTRQLSEDLILALGQYQWPGNVRELRHVLERACTVSPKKTLTLGDIDSILADLPRPEPRPARPLAQALKECQITEIKAALHPSRGVITKAAERLCITPKTLANKMKAFGIPNPRSGK